MNTRFPSPWSVEDDGGCLIVRAAGGQAVAYVYYFDKGQGKMGKLVSREEAEDLAARIVTLNVAFGIPRRARALRASCSRCAARRAAGQAHELRCDAEPSVTKTM